MNNNQRRIAFLFTLCAAAAQAQNLVPSTTPVTASNWGSPVAGTVHYALRYSQTFQIGNSSGQPDQQMSIVSGEIGYANANTRRPFTLNYGGGGTWTTTGPDVGTSVFQHLAISQGFVGRQWGFFVADNLSYLPQSPTTGFSGIPGAGDLNGGPGFSGPNPSSPPSQSILTQNTRSIYNIVNGGVSRQINYATTLNMGGSYSALRYPDSNGLETDDLQANATLSRRLNARNSINGQYIYNHYSFGGTLFANETNAAQFGFKRDWSRKLSTQFSFGPQWLQSTDHLIVPQSTTVSGNASVNYLFGQTSANVSYNRGASGGSGNMLGSETDAVGAGLSRNFGRDLTLAATFSYVRTDSLQKGGSVVDGTYGGIQATQRFGRYLTVFASYTALNQTSTGALPTNAINGLSQVVAFGIGYSPRETNLKK